MVAFGKLLPPSLREERAAAGSRMRLVSGDDVDGDEAPDTLGQIDRRVFPRQEVSIRVSGRRLDHSVEARRDPCLHVSLKDVSVGGLSGTSQTPLRVGERVAVFFPPEGVSRGWDAYGHVLRVRPEKMGYGIAVSFDRLPAA